MDKTRDKWTDSDAEDLLRRMKAAKERGDGRYSTGSYYEFKWLRFKDQSLDLAPLFQIGNVKFINCIFEHTLIGTDGLDAPVNPKTSSSRYRKLSFKGCTMEAVVTGCLDTLQMMACWHWHTHISGVYNHLALGGCAGKDFQVFDAKINKLSYSVTEDGLDDRAENRIIAADAAPDSKIERVRFGRVAIGHIPYGQLDLMERGAMMVKTVRLLSNASMTLAERAKNVYQTGETLLSSIGQSDTAKRLKERAEQHVASRGRIHASIDTLADATKEYEWDLLSEEPHIHTQLSGTGDYSCLSFKQLLFSGDGRGNQSPDISRLMLKAIFERQGLTDPAVTEPFLNLRDACVKEFKGAVAVYDLDRSTAYVIGRDIGAYQFADMSFFEFRTSNTRKFSELTGINMARSFHIEKNVRKAALDLMDIGER